MALERADFVVLYVGLLNFNLLVLEDPYLEHVWTAEDGGADKRQGTYHSLSRRGKIRWCFDNAFSTRGIGWNWGMQLNVFLAITRERILIFSGIVQVLKRVIQTPFLGRGHCLFEDGFDFLDSRRIV
ncbi:hypothetical protein UCDDS831_g05837 [Diplodia seriata]|uniref:Uncharacterized protein n=1 Tax=Diplodia seriata TaxID=420778 RepID=A0A0G2E6L4_9PEZI|nr:hypothetical protein UCDDS831_g05837 [Diplodia seriata]